MLRPDLGEDAFEWDGSQAVAHVNDHMPILGGDDVHRIFAGAALDQSDINLPDQLSL